jgi:hypothetical protein
MPQGLKPCRISPTAFGTVSRPQRPRGCRPSGAADVLARWLPHCPSLSVLGLPRLDVVLSDDFRSTRPTPALAHARVTLPATDNGRGARGLRPPTRLPASTPSALKGTDAPCPGYIKKEAKNQLRRFLATSLTPFHYVSKASPARPPLAENTDHNNQYEQYRTHNN